MKMADINNKTLDEIKRELEELEEAYANMRFQKATHQLDNPLRLRYMRKDIARIKTVIHEYEVGVRKQKNQTAEQS